MRPGLFTSGLTIRRAAPVLLALGLLTAGFLEGRSLILTPGRAGRPIVEDESVYLFQARMLLEGRLSRPSPPLPEFFEANHLLVTPRLAGKYLPGHPLVLAPFVAAGVSWAAPALLLGLLAALLFLAALAFELPPGAALLAGLAPLVTAPVADLFGTYLSWTSSLPLTAAALACLAMARRRESAGWLAAAASLTGFAFWVRPFTGLALGAVAALVALASLRALPLRARALALLAPLAVWALATALVCKEVTGRFTQLPWQLYASEYMPGDGPGFGPRHAPEPARRVEHLRWYVDLMLAKRDAYTLRAARAQLPARLQTASTYAPGAWVWALALLGLLAGARKLWPAGAFALLFLGLELTFYAPTPSYLLELAVPLALGLAALAARIGEGVAAMRNRVARGAALIAASLLAMFLLAGALDNLDELAATRPRIPPAWLRGEETLAPLRGLVFLRYGPEPELHSVELNYNLPDLAKSPLIRALDLGPRDRELMRLFPERPAFLYEVGTGALTPLPRDAR